MGAQPRVDVELDGTTVRGTRTNEVYTIRNQESVNPEDVFFQFLSHVEGPEGSDSADMVTNFAGGVNSVFEFECPPGRIAHLSRVNFVILDNNPSPNKFGALAELDNGCLVQLMDSDGSTSRSDLVDGLPIKKNAHFVYLSGTDMDELSGAGSDLVRVRWTLRSALAGRTLRLVEGQRLRWTNRDDLTGLDEFRALVQGFFEDA